MQFTINYYKQFHRLQETFCQDIILIDSCHYVGTIYILIHDEKQVKINCFVNQNGESKLIISMKK